MNKLIDRIQTLFQPVKQLPAGMYHYIAPLDDPRNYRLHLRLEPDGSGLLIVNASTVLHLNQTAAEYAYYLVKGMTEGQAVDAITSRYRVPKEIALEHYLGFVQRIDSLVSTTDLDPVTYLDFEREAPFSSPLSAPYRLDCAVTYMLRDVEDLLPEGPHAAPVDRVSRELSKEEWYSILDKSWQAGIPHVVFTGGEPTLREDLPELIAHAEANSQVSGLITDGLRLADDIYFNVLLQTGLDHMLLILDPDQEASWQAVQKVVAADIFLAVHLTLTRQNQAAIETYITRLADLGVEAVSLSMNDPVLASELQAARSFAAHKNLELVWNLPAPYSVLNPISLEVLPGPEESKPSEGAGRAWLYVEPDGDVLPGQGMNQVLGNLLSDPWEVIWRNAQAFSKQPSL